MSGFDFINTSIGRYFSMDMLSTDPELMGQKAVVVQAKINQMRNAFNSLEYAVDRTKMYWHGEAGDVYRTTFRGEKENIDIMLRRLSEHVTDLQNMAAIYAGAEKEAEDLASDLPSDVIC